MTPRSALPHFGAICEEIGETSWIKDVVEVRLQRACLFDLDSSFITTNQWEAGKPTCLLDARECSQNALQQSQSAARFPFMPPIYYQEQHQAQWLVETLMVSRCRETDLFDTQKESGGRRAGG